MIHFLPFTNNRSRYKYQRLLINSQQGIFKQLSHYTQKQNIKMNQRILNQAKSQLIQSKYSNLAHNLLFRQKKCKNKLVLFSQWYNVNQICSTFDLYELQTAGLFKLKPVLDKRSCKKRKCMAIATLSEQNKIQ
ncbi:hypothetical protein ABPG73_016979 [Tetrahymena malaccensis]